MGWRKPWLLSATLLKRTMLIDAVRTPQCLSHSSGAPGRGQQLQWIHA